MKQHIAISWSSFALVFILSCPTYAQGQTDQAKNSLVAGAKALQFEIDSDFDITSFQGSVISYKVHSSSGSATRIGLSLSLTGDDLSEFGLQADGSSRIPTKKNQQFVGFVLQRVFHTSTAERTSFFWGLGFVGSFLRSETESSSRTTTPAGENEVTKRMANLTEWSGGASVLAGVEVFLGERVSLLGEYRLDLIYTRTDMSFRGERFLDGSLRSGFEDANIIERWDLAAQPVKFGISVYFL